MSAANGCEVRSLSDNANCGVCGRACAAGRVCAAGACVATCAAPLSLCGGGCVNTSNDPSNCGSCGASCSAGANATAVCAAGSCAFVCGPGFADCDRNPANGCEVNLTSSVTHCGACGLSCPVRPGAASVCAAGSCGFLCASGTADCDGNPGNGCEASTTSVSNCGACGVACPARPGATAACTAGACRSSCIAGFADCDGNPTNGCEVDTRTSSTNCGGCGTACPSGRVCAGGTCLSATSCRSIREQNSSAPSGVYLIDPDGAGSGAAFNVYCEMSTAGGGWTVMAYLRSNAQWDTPVFSNTGTVGNTSGGLRAGRHALGERRDLHRADHHLPPADRARHRPRYAVDDHLPPERIRHALQRVQRQLGLGLPRQLRLRRPDGEQRVHPRVRELPRAGDVPRLGVGLRVRRDPGRQLRLRRRQQHLLGAAQPRLQRRLAALLAAQRNQRRRHLRRSLMGPTVRAPRGGCPHSSIPPCGGCARCPWRSRGPRRPTRCPTGRSPTRTARCGPRRWCCT
ncbi:MAG: hypothetical protein IPF99_27475 [Deltaproteobacteria bacterium]|nr:hypothetical protein [Deltaproteobacteria bacterium]